MSLTQLPTVETEEYFQDLIKHVGLDTVSIRYLSDKMGKGMFAQRDVPESEVLYTESRRFGKAHDHNPLDSCMGCMRILGSVDDLWEMAEELSQVMEHVQKSGGCCGGTEHDHSHEEVEKKEGEALCCCEDDGHHDDVHDDVVDASEESDFVPVERPAFEKICDAFGFDIEDLSRSHPVECKCGEQYCSEECRTQEWNSSHQLLCPSTNKNVAVFLAHVEETNEAILVAARIIASIVLSTERAGGDAESLDNILKPLRVFESKPWPEVVCVPEDVDEEERTQFSESLQLLIDDTASLLSEALSSYASNPVYEPLFTSSFMSLLMGLMELNNVGMASRSPLSVIHDALEGEDEEDASARAEALSLINEQQRNRLSEHAEIASEGFGLYTLTSCINHSCDPNVALLKPIGGLDSATTLVAIRPLVAGEQLFISYIDEDLPLEERQAALEDYGFVCECNKCILDAQKV